MIDKYDVLLVLSKIKEFYKNRKNLCCRYRIIKKDWMYRYYYTLRMKRSSEYRKKNPLEIENAIHKAGVLKTK
jgi:hypothetical protein